MSSSHPKFRIDPGAVATDLLGPVASVLVDTARTVAFWVAIVLPFLYIPLLASGDTAANVLPPVATLVVVNVVALVVGHGHRRAEAADER